MLPVGAGGFQNTKRRNQLAEGMKRDGKKTLRNRKSVENNFVVVRLVAEQHKTALVLKIS